MGPAIGVFSWPVLLYALLSLTVIRMLPAYVVMTGHKASPEDKLFIGWFGPCGLASVVFIVMAMAAKLPHQTILASSVAYTVLLSILLHGLTARPWAKSVGKRSPASEAPAASEA